MTNALIPLDQPIGDRLNQNGVRPGPKKLCQFQEAMQLRGVPSLYSQESKGEDAIAHVKLFHADGSWEWYVTEFSLIAPDKTPNLAFGLINGHDVELGYISIEELASLDVGVGIELDCWFIPKTLAAIRRTLGRA